MSIETLTLLTCCRDKALKKKYLETAMNMMVENRKHVFDMVEKGLVTKNVVC